MSKSMNSKQIDQVASIIWTKKEYEEQLEVKIIFEAVQENIRLNLKKTYTK